MSLIIKQMINFSRARSFQPKLRFSKPNFPVYIAASNHFSLWQTDYFSSTFRVYRPYKNYFSLCKLSIYSLHANRHKKQWNDNNNSEYLPCLLLAACLVNCAGFWGDDKNTNLSKEDVESLGHSLLQSVCSNNLTKVKSILNTIKSVEESSKSSVLNFRHVLGWTPLMVAAINGKNAILSELLNAGTDPNLGDMFNLRTVRNMSKFNARMLREEEFSDNLVPNADFRGFTSLHYAVISDSISTVKILLEKGADPLLKNHMGHSADEYCSNINQQLIDLLKKARNDAAEKKKLEEAKERAMYPLEQRLKDKIIGQEGAIATVASAIRRKQNGWYDEDHPLVFLFLGSSGIGKTELAKQVANYLHKNNKKGFIRLDMSEYQEKHEVAKLIGSPPGYIGHDEGGQLTKRLRAQPNAVVLFDEVDKAHPDVLTVLLQLFDEGRLTDGRGQTIECKDAVFVMTSNLAADEIAEYGAQLRLEAKQTQTKKLSVDVNKTSTIKEDFGSEITVVSRQFKEKVVRPILKRHFGRDEFLGRINEFVYFLPFSEDELFSLVECELKMWGKHAKERHSINLVWKVPEVPTILADGYNIHYGARSIKYEVDRRVVALLAVAHERGLLERNCSVTVQNSTSLEKVQSSMFNCQLQLKIDKKGSKSIILNEKDMYGHTEYKSPDKVSMTW